MHIVDHDRRRIHRGDGSVRSLDLDGPQVWFWVLTRAIHQRQTGQKQHLGDWTDGSVCVCVCVCVTVCNFVGA